MTRDEILSMAREARLLPACSDHTRAYIPEGLYALELEKFAELATAKERAARQEAQAMAECLDMLRSDLIVAGVVWPDVAPMFLTEAVLSAVSRALVARIEAQQHLADLQAQLVRADAERCAAVAAERKRITQWLEEQAEQKRRCYTATNEKAYLEASDVLDFAIREISRGQL